MRIVVTGREGQVVRSLIERTSSDPSLEVVALGRPELDLTDPASITSAIVAARPDIVVSAAAYTAVDQAEDEPDLAFLINEKGAGAVAHAARLAGAPVIHLSTDYVFSGETDEPYSEASETGPRSVYGASKLAGEAAVREANPDHLILRTAWVYSPFAKNFVKTMLKLAETRDQLNVVDDQHGNPTSALDIADAILAIIGRWTMRGNRSKDVYHFAGAGEATWCSFARHIFRTSRELGGPFAEAAAITTSQYPTKANRPKNSRLDCSRFASDLGHRPREWQASTEAVVRRLQIAKQA
jgi:dTDP-4-dehydrorhamnose reductase